MAKKKICKFCPDFRSQAYVKTLNRGGDPLEVRYCKVVRKNINEVSHMCEKRRLTSSGKEKAGNGKG